MEYSLKSRDNKTACAFRGLAMSTTGPDRKIVILVERDTESRDAFQRALIDAGFSVRCFPDYAGALDDAESARRIDLLITGLQLPAGTPHGLSLAAMIRMRRPRLPILFIADDEALARMVGTGPITLIKPIDISALTQIASQLIGESSLS
jgi:DNA-binding NtrC family response regulator